MAATSSQVVVTSIKEWAVEWINRKCSSCTSQTWEIKWAADSHQEETSKWCIKTRRTWANTIKLSKTQWELLVAWAWWAQCKVVCHSTWEECQAWESRFSSSHPRKETTQTFSLSTLATFLTRLSTLTCWNSLTQRDTNSQASKSCSTLSPRDQKALVILTSIPKRRLTDVWPKWIMLQLMTDALSSIENKTKQVDLIVKLTF